MATTQIKLERVCYKCKQIKFFDPSNIKKTSEYWSRDRTKKYGFKHLCKECDRQKCKIYNMRVGRYKTGKEEQVNMSDD